jgi:hypothetical protein
MSAITKSLNWFNNLSWVSILVIGTTLTGGYFLWDTYQEQLFNYWPYLILLLCPVMHIFMHRGQGGHEDHKDHKSSQEQ